MTDAAKNLSTQARKLSPAERLELDEAIVYYNGESPGLGDAFLLEAAAAIARIRRFPEAWHPLGYEIRRCRLRRFSCALLSSPRP